MSRDWRLSWDDIIASCAKVQRYTQGMDLTSFRADERTCDAVVRNLEIIGEAVKNLPDEARARAPKVEWRKIVGFRDVAAHAYFGIDDAILWDIVMNKVPELLAALRQADADESS